MKYLLAIKTNEGNEIFSFPSKHDRAVALNEMKEKLGDIEYAFSSEAGK